MLINNDNSSNDNNNNELAVCCVCSSDPGHGSDQTCGIVNGWSPYYTHPALWGRQSPYLHGLCRSY